MKKTFLRKIICAGTIATTIATLAPLGVSASTITSSTQTNNTISTGWKQISNNWYYYNSNGNVKTGWIYSNGAWYYTNNSGKMVTGLQTINGKTYYFNSNGAMQTGKVLIDGKYYYFASNGALIGSNSGTTNNGNTNSGSNSGTTNNGNTNSGSNTESNNSGSTNSGTTTNDSLSVSGLPQITQKYSASVVSSAETTILNLMNEKRTEAGLQPLTLDTTLVSVARYKSNHMIQNGYFSHTNPDGTNWTNWLKTLGYSYSTTGENIAYNTYDPVELFNQWWNSEGHRANMMNANYTKVGIGVVLGNGKYMGTQTFAK